MPIEPVESIPITVLHQSDPELQSSGPGVQSPDSFMREFRESRRIVEDIQRGTLEHVFVTKGHPNEAYLDSGLMGMNIGNPHPWWGSEEAEFNDIGKDMFLIRREFTKLTDRLSKDDRWTEIRLLYQRRVCPFGYEEDYTTSSQTLQVWWLGEPGNPDRPARIPIALAEGMPVPMPQVQMRRHWAHVVTTTNAIRGLKALQNTTNEKVFAGEAKGFWLLESVQARQLYGTRIGDHPTNDHYELSMTWRGDPIRHHELWFANFGDGVVPVKPTSMSFEHLAEVHDRFTIFKQTEDFDEAIKEAIGESAICGSVA